MSGLSLWQALRERIEILESHVTDLYRLILELRDEVERLKQYHQEGGANVSPSASGSRLKHNGQGR